ncbi:MAG: hypothetical protein LBF28_01880 [Rickettsiales bacterium]|jgi:polyhydroxyalkanoate synthesis regulator phasin|nr:hypothetical protein [Rickettsiales bacterium]
MTLSAETKKWLACGAVALALAAAVIVCISFYNNEQDALNSVKKEKYKAEQAKETVEELQEQLNERNAELTAAKSGKDSLNISYEKCDSTRNELMKRDSIYNARIDSLNNRIGELNKRPGNNSRKTSRDGNGNRSGGSSSTTATRTKTSSGVVGVPGAGSMTIIVNQGGIAQFGTITNNYYNGQGKPETIVKTDNVPETISLEEASKVVKDTTAVITNQGRIRMPDVEFKSVTR